MDKNMIIENNKIYIQNYDKVLTIKDVRKYIDKILLGNFTDDTVVNLPDGFYNTGLRETTIGLLKLNKNIRG